MVSMSSDSESEDLLRILKRSEDLLLTVKSRFLVRPPAERLLLSIIDANPDAGTDMKSATWRNRREIRLKQAVRALFGGGVRATGQQRMSDQSALRWMASERYRDRFFEQVSNGPHPLFLPGSQSYKRYREIMGDSKFRSDRTLADQAAERHFGPFDEVADYDLKRSHSERLRRKWRDQSGFWNWDVLYNDYVDESIESKRLERCHALLRKRGIRTVRNDLAGMPANKRRSNVR